MDAIRLPDELSCHLVLRDGDLAPPLPRARAVFASAEMARVFAEGHGYYVRRVTLRAGDFPVGPPPADYMDKARDGFGYVIRHGSTEEVRQQLDLLWALIFFGKLPVVENLHALERHCVQAGALPSLMADTIRSDPEMRASLLGRSSRRFRELMITL